MRPHRSFAAVFLIFCCLTFAHPHAESFSAQLGAGLREAGGVALTTLKAPQVWGCGALAIACYATGLDQMISAWASGTNPVFGSISNADRWSTILRNSTEYGYFASTATQLILGPESKNRLLMLAATLGTGFLAVNATAAATGAGKTTVGRYRPDLSDHYSFPSGHTSTAAVFSTLGCKVIDRLDIPAPGKAGLQLGFALLTASTAWGRIEAKKHYPSDVLAGAAIGYFCGAFLSDMISNRLFGDKADVQVQADRTGFGLSMRCRF